MRLRTDTGYKLNINAFRHSVLLRKRQVYSTAEIRLAWMVPCCSPPLRDDMPTSRWSNCRRISSIPFWTISQAPRCILLNHLQNNDGSLSSHVYNISISKSGIWVYTAINRVQLYDGVHAHKPFLKNVRTCSTSRVVSVTQANRCIPFIVVSLQSNLYLEWPSQMNSLNIFRVENVWYRKSKVLCALLISVAAPSYIMPIFK